VAEIELHFLFQKDLHLQSLLFLKLKKYHLFLHEPQHAVIQAPLGQLCKEPANVQPRTEVGTKWQVHRLALASHSRNFHNIPMRHCQPALGMTHLSEANP